MALHSKNGVILLKKHLFFIKNRLFFDAFWSKIAFCCHIFICCHSTRTPLNKGRLNDVWQCGSNFSKKIKFQAISTQRHMRLIITPRCYYITTCSLSDAYIFSARGRFSHRERPFCWQRNNATATT